jgi:hypothetical protein
MSVTPRSTPGPRSGEGWAAEEIKEFGGRNHKNWTALYDDECFVTKAGAKKDKGKR